MPVFGKEESSEKEEKEAGYIGKEGEVKAGKKSGERLIVIIKRRSTDAEEGGLNKGGNEGDSRDGVQAEI